MYAIIRAGGKQAKVQEGDVLSVERIKDTETVSFTPLLIVGDDGTVISDREALEKASVTAEVLGASAGPKVDIFKYKNKTGYRRRQGHRQKYTTIKVTSIVAPGTAKKSAKTAPKKVTKTDDTESAETAAERPAAETRAAKTSAAEKPAAKKAAAAKPATAKKTAAPKTDTTATAEKATKTPKADKE
jgi:large subunit ribosomal protein L21